MRGQSLTSSSKKKYLNVVNSEKLERRIERKKNDAKKLSLDE